MLVDSPLPLFPSLCPAEVGGPAKKNERAQLSDHQEKRDFYPFPGAMSLQGYRMILFITYFYFIYTLFMADSEASASHLSRQDIMVGHLGMSDRG